MQPAAQVAGGGGLGNGVAHRAYGGRVFGADVDVSALSTDRAAYAASLGDPVRVLFHQHPVTKRSGVALVTIADDVARRRGARPRRPTWPRPDSRHRARANRRGCHFGDQPLRRPRPDDIRPVMPRIVRPDAAESTGRRPQ